jgi:hypothetical protein
MQRVLIFGTGSPLLVDIEESLRRAGIGLYGGVQNRPGENYLSGQFPAFSPLTLPAEARDYPFLLPFFTPGNRQKALEEAAALGLHLPFSLIDPSVPAPRAIQFEPGFYVNCGCSLGAASEFGRFVLINRGASVGHHARFASFVSIGPGAVIAGQVSIGKGSMVAAGAVVLPKIRIGENVVVAAGAVVTRDVPDFCIVAGNPARIVKEQMAGYNGKIVA